MPRYTVTANNTIKTPQNARTFKGETIPFSIDFSPWADENGALTSATWTVLKGDASVSGAAFTANVASANIAFSQSGTSLIEIKAQNASLVKKQYLSVFADDPDDEPNDYLD